MQNKKGDAAPTFWSMNEDECDSQENMTEILEERKRKIEHFSDNMCTTDPSAIRCDEHEGCQERVECSKCDEWSKIVLKFQQH